MIRKGPHINLELKQEAAWRDWPPVPRYGRANTAQAIRELIAEGYILPAWKPMPHPAVKEEDA